jgi:hypothetical protein
MQSNFCAVSDKELDILNFDGHFPNLFVVAVFSLGKLEMSIDPGQFETFIRPDQLAIIQSVFDDLVRETWFHDTAQNREDLAAIVMHTFQNGTTREFSLLEACHEQARERFKRT